jgi:hypothetical protein
MKRIVLLAAAISLISLNAAGAQDFTVEQRAACLNKQHDQLSDACKKVVDAQKK